VTKHPVTPGGSGRCPPTYRIAPGRAPRSGMTRRLSTHRTRYAVSGTTDCPGAGRAERRSERRHRDGEVLRHSVQPVGIEHRDIGLGPPAGGDRPQTRGRA
jgi:hypothetical protein